MRDKNAKEVCGEERVVGLSRDFCVRKIQSILREQVCAGTGNYIL